MQNISNIQEGCVGCGACCQACPHKAITMKPNHEGFLYPVIDKEKCVNCGLCVHVCPISCESYKRDNKHPDCFAVQSSDDFMKHSSSGGMFSVLATYILENGGYVCGAGFDKTWSVEHKIISDISGLYELQTSKYVQSDTKTVFKEIQKLLSQNKTVLFSGTPCQVAGLYAFLKKDYDNLLTIDVFCHGTPSPGIFQKYLNELNLKNIKDINFRDKTPPANWTDFALSIESSSGKIQESLSENIYMLGFLRNLFLRKSCHQCPFAKVLRQGDFSLGDFWGYKPQKHTLDVQKGMSAVLLNTTKSQNYFKKIKSQLSFIQPVKLASMTKGNPVLVSPVRAHPNRTYFFKEFQNNAPVIPLIEKYLGNKKVAIFNFSSFTTNNFGACLVGYAMEHAVSKLGYTPSTINFIPKSEVFDRTKPSPFQDFRQKFLNLTGICSTKKELKKNLNDAFDKFIIGSDQIVRHPNYDFAYYLDWVSGRKNLLSYAASFGTAKLEMDKKRTKYAKRCLDRFDAFSVRELSGANIMKTHFGKNNTPVVCDPTLLLDAKDYQPIIDAENLSVPAGEYVAYYLLDESPEVLTHFSKKYKLINAYKDDSGQYRSFGEWLNIIKNAKYVITDSFHGSVFSIIYKRQFVTLTTKERGNERLESLMKILGENRLIDNRDNLTEQSLFSKKIDYIKANKNILAAQQQGYDYLDTALKIKPNKKKNIFKIHPKKSYFWLFGILPLMKTTSNKSERVNISLFGLPIFKVKFGKFYLFGFIKIGYYR
ncbi:MAG: Coenzyme F420 hydrogenase/dehydrogenase, beta subunit C-terminal domain [Alphaproteobacteria bacterium]|nr:Coenzyme F420 hydrogenase/dehydrogenase, beta subunit C-terminal domain [Alphaproteobacteria bacterium]